MARKSTPVEKCARVWSWRVWKSTPVEKRTPVEACPEPVEGQARRCPFGFGLSARQRRTKKRTGGALRRGRAAGHRYGGRGRIATRAEWDGFRLHIDRRDRIRHSRRAAPSERASISGRILPPRRSTGTEPNSALIAASFRPTRGELKGHCLAYPTTGSGNEHPSRDAGRQRSARSLRIWSTSPCICLISDSMPSNFTWPRIRVWKSIAISTPYSSRSVRSRT